MKTAKRLPRLARIVRSYLQLLSMTDIEFMERSKLKGRRVEQMRRELERMESRRAGFTLVEMLVAVAVVVVMMSLFAQIFQMATSSMSLQKGMAENDQRVRLVHSLFVGRSERRHQ